MKMTSRFALVAAAGLLIGAVTTSAEAADLGGGCCADLEERVAELEATTARKGNRVVSLQVYGQVNKALLFFDDGDDNDAYVVDHDASGSRFGFTGAAALKPGWMAGYRMEINVQDAASDQVDNDTDFDDPEDEFFIRHSYFYIESERFGRVSVGQQSSATEEIDEIVLGNSLASSALFVGNDIIAVGTGLRVDQFVNTFGSSRDDLIRYDSPSVAGFILSASWGDDDYYDVALRFQNEWNSIRLAAGVGYFRGDDQNGTGTGSTAANLDVERIAGSISVMHVPTGLYGAFAAADTEENNFDNDSSYWYTQLGIEKQFLAYGSTTVYGEYGEYNDVVNIEGAKGILGSEGTRWGFGVVQKVNAAAMDFYAQAQFFDLEAETFPIAATDGDNNDFNLDGDVSTVIVGARIKF